MKFRIVKDVVPPDWHLRDLPWLLHWLENSNVQQGTGRTLQRLLQPSKNHRGFRLARVMSSTHEILWNAPAESSTPTTEQRVDMAARLARGMGEVLMAVFQKEEKGAVLFCYNATFKAF